MKNQMKNQIRKIGVKTVNGLVQPIHSTLHITNKAIALSAGAVCHVIDDSRTRESYVLDIENKSERSVLIVGATSTLKFNLAQIAKTKNNEIRELKIKMGSNFTKDSKEFLRIKENALKSKEKAFNEYSQSIKEIRDGVYDKLEEDLNKPLKKYDKVESIKESKISEKVQDLKKEMFDTVKDVLKELPQMDSREAFVVDVSNLDSNELSELGIGV